MHYLSSNTLALACSVLIQSERQGKPSPEIAFPGETYDGWVWRNENTIYLYKYGWFTGEDGLIRVMLTPESIGELWLWEMIEPLTGHLCSLPLTECPHCYNVCYLGADYLCLNCRKETDNAYPNLTRSTQPHA